MYVAYSLLLSLGLLVLIPHFLYKALAHGKYLEGLRQRLGSLPPIDRKRPLIWLHCVSVGETQAARPLVDRLKKEFPDHALVVSTITRTGQKLAQDVFHRQAHSVFYFPFDWRWSVRRALRTVNPSVVLLMETELWPNFLRECKARAVPVALVNGRISRQSFRRYSLIKFFLRRVLESLSIAVMQSETDARRLQDLGMHADRIRTAGNLKFDAGAVPSATEKTAEIRERFGLNASAPLVLAASTHAPEEKIILESFKRLPASQSVRLMLAPRHPERFQEVASLIQNSGLSWARRTNPATAADKDASVILLDTIGELPATYALATVVFVGGSIVDRGGHNMLEPAAARTPVVTGAYTHNFHAIVDLLNEARAIVQLPPVEGDAASNELAKALNDLLTNPEHRNQLAARATQLIADNQGATERTINFITPLLSTKRRQFSIQLSSGGETADFMKSLILPPLSVLYGAITRTRVSLYRRGTFHSTRLSRPVISIGNITTGGTGKTPLVELVARTVAREGKKVCILTRGYGRDNPDRLVVVSDGKSVLATPSEAGDEPFLLATNLVGVAAVISSTDRATGGKEAIRQFDTDCFVLDDGFQHLRIERDLNIVTIDATDPWGGGHLLPYGRLREPLSGLSRADIVVITRTDQADNIDDLRHEIRNHAGNVPIFLSRMRTSRITRLDGSSEAMVPPVAAFCAVGNPRSFFNAVPYELVLQKAFPDHHRYSQPEIDSLTKAAKHAGANSLITTAKDAVKLRDLSFAIPCHVLEIEPWIENKDELIELIRSVLR